MNSTKIAIIGGGLAGLTAAIHLSQNGFEVTLFEKDEYPNHKVCGEYLSNEILPYLLQIGVDLKNIKYPEITRMQYSSGKGEMIDCNLDLGGMGICRYTLDEFLFQKALELNVEVIHAIVSTISFNENTFTLSYGNKDDFSADFVLGAYGKRSSLDKSMNRKFISSNSGWLGIKAHYQNEDFPDDLVALHNFEGGYCGLSRTDLGTVNVCYLASYKSFKRYKDPEIFQREVMMQNPNLRIFFNNSSSVFENNLSIAQISFDKKSTVENHILMLGDAAGLIHPLCGNGMAMAIHSAKIAADAILKFSGEIEKRSLIEKEYEENWRKNFRNRLIAGRTLQKILLDPKLSKMSQKMVQSFPGLMPKLIKLTHGKPVHA